jgi:tRNA-dihydrouridine synthase A
MPINRKFCIAPMMDWTDRHCRYFLRLISQHTVLYTEMVTTGAIIYGDAHRHLQMHEGRATGGFATGGQ